MNPTESRDRPKARLGLLTVIQYDLEGTMRCVTLAPNHTYIALQLRYAIRS